MRSWSIVIIFLFCTYSTDYAQLRRNVRTILSQLGNTAQAYLLSANRPSYTVDAYTNDENTWEIDASLAISKDLAEVPIGISYGVTDRFELFTGIDLYTQSYNFNGDKIEGIGDANIGFIFEFQESRHFVHVFQALVKLPTASSQTQLGTGLADWHFGIAQGFEMNRFGYQLSLEFNLLHRRRMPAGINSLPIILRDIVENIAKSYNYKFEPEFIFTFSPSYDISKRSTLYTGISYSRNLRLNYNTSQIFAGFAYQTSDNFAFSIGGTLGLQSPLSFIFTTGISLTI